MSGVSSHRRWVRIEENCGFLKIYIVGLWSTCDLAVVCGSQIRRFMWRLFMISEDGACLFSISVSVDIGCLSFLVHFYEQ